MTTAADIGVLICNAGKSPAFASSRTRLVRRSIREHFKNLMEAGQDSFKRLRTKRARHNARARS